VPSFRNVGLILGLRPLLTVSAVRLLDPRFDGGPGLEDFELWSVVSLGRRDGVSPGDYGRKRGNHMFGWRRIGPPVLVCAATLLGLFATTSPADASTARLDKAGVLYEADPGELNDVTITDSTTGSAPVAIDIADGGAAITPHGPWPHRWGCRKIDPKAIKSPVWCALETPTSTLSVWLGDQIDTFIMRSSAPAWTGVRGGPGHDLLVGAAGTENLWGDADDDILDGGGGTDLLSGGSGYDQVDGGTGSDMFRGGLDFDMADYRTRTAPVKVSLNTLPSVGWTGFTFIPGDDGEAGEADNVFMDVEGVLGGEGDDELIGSSVNNSLLGNGGHDWVVGHGGNDSLIGGAGMDGLNGNDGDDDISARDGEFDAVDCGNGVDSALVDMMDALTGCESVLRYP
jgi:Ca2+-binding RTX toxin-like protein